MGYDLGLYQPLELEVRGEIRFKFSEDLETRREELEDVIHLLHCCQVVSHQEGGNYVLGGTNDAELSVTYNYARWFHQYIDPDEGIRWLYGRYAKDTIDKLENAVAELGTSQHHDYWQSTEGNAGYALGILLSWARQHPDGIWFGD